MFRAFVLAALAAALVGAGEASTSTAAKPYVLLADRAPVKIVGGGFDARERVTVRVAPGGRAAYSKIVTATSMGRITALFATRSLGECAPVRVVATGNMGSRAVRIEIPPPGACGIDPAP